MVATNLLDIYQIFNLNSLKPCIKMYTFHEKLPTLQVKKALTLTRTCQTDQMNEIAAGKTRTHNNRPITRLHNYPFYRGRVPWGWVIFGVFFTPQLRSLAAIIVLGTHDEDTRTHTQITKLAMTGDGTNDQNGLRPRTLHYRRLVVPLTDSIFPPFDDVQRKWSNL